MLLLKIKEVESKLYAIPPVVISQTYSSGSDQNFSSYKQRDGLTSSNNNNENPAGLLASGSRILGMGQGGSKGNLKSAYSKHLYPLST